MREAEDQAAPAQSIEDIHSTREDQAPVALISNDVGADWTRCVGAPVPRTFDRTDRRTGRDPKAALTMCLAFTSPYSCSFWFRWSGRLAPTLWNMTAMSQRLIPAA